MGGSKRIRRALGAAALIAVTATAQNAVATDIETLRDRAQKIGDEVTAMGEQLDGLAKEKRELAAEFEAANVEIATIEYEIAEADDVYDEALARFEERAVEAYKSGFGVDVEMLLSARTLTELETISQAMSEASQLDEAAIEELLAAKADAEAAQARLDERKSRLMAMEERASELAQDIELKVASRDDLLKSLNEDIKDLEREALVPEGGTPVDAGLPDAPVTPPDTTWGTHSPDRLVGTGPSDGIPATFTSTGVAFEGDASWYGPGFEGNTTANGDIFDSRLYTVASKTLPFGTYLYVEYGGRGVVVYVNDRGPYVGARILDLSRSAAEAIGISGVGWVRAEIIVKN